jgi:hypothetical protein
MSLLKFVLISILAMLCASAVCGAPVIFFSDLDWGPNAGWEGSSTKGAAVTVWGENFGSTRGSSYVSVNGAQITEYAEWGVVGPARGLQRITFWLNSNCQVGDGTITVTVGGIPSNTLAFKVVPGTAAKIYFVSVSNGNNNNNGLYSATQGGSNGPFKDVFMFNPGLDEFHASTNRNPSGDGQYIMYIRGGTYTATDADSVFVALRGPYGGPDKRKALIGYPGETSNFNTANAERGIIWNADYSPYGKNSYFTWSKLNGIGGLAAAGVIGDYNRVIGCTFKEYLDYAQDGVVWVTASQHTSIYGNLFEHNGCDSMKHNIYVKTQAGFSGDRNTIYTSIGWNEFSNAYSSDTHGGVIFISKSSDGGAYSTANVYIHNNYFHDGNMDFIYSGDGPDMGDIFVYNNIFSGGTSANGGITMYDGTNNIYFYNNVFYQMGPADQPMAWETGKAKSYFKNNIWYSRSGQAFFNLETFKGATFSSDHDLFYGNTAPSGATNVKTGDPKFVSAGTDFHLQAGSPAIDAGANTVSSTVTNDYDSNPRPMDGNNDGTAAYDIGAYEYTGTYVPPTDTTAPVRSGGSPSAALAAGTTSTAISLLTNEAATCRYSLSASTAFGGMVGTFSATGGTSHSAIVSGLQNGNSYRYYVRCSDVVGNVNGDDFVIGFSVAQAGSTCISGDLNCDGSVNIFDLVLVAQNFGRASGFDVRADANKDGAVNIFDLVLVAQNFGRTG